MRPTCLKFRNPKEETPGFNYPLITRKGHSLEPKNRQGKSTFSREGRFQHIQNVARRTGFNIGPGAYDYKISTNRGNGIKMVKDTAIQNPRRWDYSYIEGSIIKSEKPQSRALTPCSTQYMNSSMFANEQELIQSYSANKERLVFSGKRLTSARPPSQGLQSPGFYAYNHRVRKNGPSLKALNKSTGDDRYNMDENEIQAKYYLEQTRASTGQQKEIKEEAETEV